MDNVWFWSLWERNTKGDIPTPSSIISYRQTCGLIKHIVHDCTMIVLIHQYEMSKSPSRFYCSLRRSTGLRWDIFIIRFQQQIQIISGASYGQNCITCTSPIWIFQQIGHLHSWSSSILWEINLITFLWKPQQDVDTIITHMQATTLYCMLSDNLIIFFQI